MIKNYFTIALRNFLRHKSFAILNVLGLTLGLVASLFILQYVKYEKSFDTFHGHAKDIYRMQYNVYQNNALTIECAAAVPAVGPALKNNFPEVIQFTRLFPFSGNVSYNDGDGENKVFVEEKMQITDPAVFEIFDFNLLAGNEATALEGPDKTVISQSAAKKFFGEEDPMNKFIWFDGSRKAQVTGVFEDIPNNSHIKFNVLCSYETLNRETENSSETSWGWYDFNTYVLLAPGTDVPALQQKWDDYVFKERGENWAKSGNKREFLFQPLLDIHLYSNLLQESLPEEQGNGDVVYFLSIIAFFILFIAWVNYINLATAQSFTRATEVGVRKVMGAKKGQLMYQFLTESFIINFIAALIAIAIIWLGWPLFKSLAGREIPIGYLVSLDFWLLVLGLFAVGTLFSGTYPALVLSSFKPIAILKGKLITSKGSILRKGLVIFQFVASVFLISSTVILYQQLTFMQNKDLGVNIAKTMVLKGPNIFIDSLYNQSMEAFKTEALKIAAVEKISVASNVPGNEIYWTRTIRRLQGGPISGITVYNVGIDRDYISTFDLNLLSGRNFSDIIDDNYQNLLINQTMAKSLLFEDPEKAIGEKVRLGGDTLEIIGVLANYHQMSLKNKMAPMVFLNRSSSSFYSMKIGNNNYQEVLADLKEPWNAIFPGNPIDYFFLDEFFNKQYVGDKQYGKVFGIFSGLAIFVACLGLFGLASFMTVQRTKEIGIRKVLGSTVGNMVLLLSKGFLSLVLIANLLAWPLAWWVMNNWLDNFPYRIDVNPILFLFAGGLVVLIAFCSVGFQTLKAAMLNPSDTLKYE